MDRDLGDGRREILAQMIAPCAAGRAQRDRGAEAASRRRHGTGSCGTATGETVLEHGKGTSAKGAQLDEPSKRVDSEPGGQRQARNRPRLEGDAIARVAADAEECITQVSDVADEYARGDGPFPERIHVNALLATLMIEQARAASRWATWARDEVERWTDATTPDVEWAVRALRRVLDGEPVSGAP